MKEREINLVNLLIGFLLHWRSIIIVVMLGMALMGTISYVQSINANKIQIDKITDAKERIEILTEKTQNEGSLSDEEQKELEELEFVVEKGVTTEKGISIVYVLVGAILAVGAYAFMFLMISICSPYICVTDELEELFSIDQLGVIAEERKSDKFLGKIDDLIIRMAPWNKSWPTEVRALQLAYVSVGLIAEKNGLETVYFVGGNIKGHTAYVCEQLKAALEKKDIHVEVLNNVLYDPEAMSKLEHAQGVVLVEKVGAAKYKEIQREIDLMNRLNISVWGGIIVQ